jgi:hypothetical protein
VSGAEGAKVTYDIVAKRGKRAQKICGYLVHARVSLKLSTIELLRARRHLADGQLIERGDLTPGRSRDAPGFQRRDD